jgi:hypothetical protein
VNGAFEGDLIRPLGLVTLNFGYAEYELDIDTVAPADAPAGDESEFADRPTRQPASPAVPLSGAPRRASPRVTDWNPRPALERPSFPDSRRCNR